MVHGYTEMMISEYCAIASFMGTGKKENCPMPCVTEDYALKDRKGSVPTSYRSLLPHAHHE